MDGFFQVFAKVLPHVAMAREKREKERRAREQEGPTPEKGQKGKKRRKKEIPSKGGGLLELAINRLRTFHAVRHEGEKKDRGMPDMVMHTSTTVEHQRQATHILICGVWI